MRYRILRAAFCTLAACAAGCGQVSHAQVEGQQSPEAHAVDAIVEEMAVGDLLSVDVDRRTIRLATDEGTRLTFGYDDDTEIARTDAAQGLAGTVTRVAVLYRPDAASPEITGRAVRVVLAE